MEFELFQKVLRSEEIVDPGRIGELGSPVLYRMQKQIDPLTREFRAVPEILVGVETRIWSSNPKPPNER